jgi:hypothetical protein
LTSLVNIFWRSYFSSFIFSDEEYVGEVEEYDDLDVRYDNQYWMTDNTLSIDGSIPFAELKGQGQPSHTDHINLYALNKLSRFVFKKNKI